MPTPEPVLPSLRADCGRCAGLCCVGLAFSTSADFPVDKASGEPCHNLDASDRCRIHTELRPTGYVGCTVFECQGAGQQTTQVVLQGRAWREAPDESVEIFAVFQVMRSLHELLWLLTEVRDRAPDAGTAVEATAQLTVLASIVGGDAGDVLRADLALYRRAAAPLLDRVSESVRGSRRVPKRFRPGADLAGASLRGSRLRGASLRNAVLIAADLREADLRDADLLAADVRNTDLRGADLSTALFVTQQQLNAARGDAATRVPPRLTRPDHWS